MPVSKKTEPNSTKVIEGNATYVEFETPYIITYAGPALDGTVERKKVKSFDIKDLPNLEGKVFNGRMIHTIEFQSEITKQMTMGDNTVSQSVEKNIPGRYFIDGFVAKGGPEQDENTGLKIKPRKSGIWLPFTENDVVITLAGNKYKKVGIAQDYLNSKDMRP